MYEILDFFKLNISMDYKDYTVNVFRQRKSYINQFELKYGKCYLWNENYLYIFWTNNWDVNFYRFQYIIFLKVIKNTCFVRLVYILIRFCLFSDIFIRDAIWMIVNIILFNK